MDHAIPEDSRIEVVVCPRESLLVFDACKDRSEYMFGEEKTIGSFLAALEFRRIHVKNLVVLGDGTEQGLEKLLRDLEIRELHLQERTATLARETNEKRIASDATDEGTQGALLASPSSDDTIVVRDFKSMKMIRRLGNGNFGVMTLAEDPETHESIALKPIKLKEASAAQSFTNVISEVTLLI
jgi:hypothetical protein